MTVAWITGGSRGIGRATALHLASLGMDVAVGFHEQEAHADDVVRRIETQGPRAIAVAGDMADPKAVEKAHARIKDTLGPVDVLVVSHGIYTRRSFEELDLTTWQRTMDVNLTGAFLATKAVLPGMRANRHGRIVYLGSIRGRTGSSHGAHYGASKAALLGLCRSVAQEVAADGITVNLIAPGMIDTDILADDTPTKRREREQTVPVRRVGQPEEIAAAVAYLVSDAAAYVTGTELRVDGGSGMG